MARQGRAEREARLAGEVVAADCYPRQVTFFEIAFDLMTEVSEWTAGRCSNASAAVASRITQDRRHPDEPDPRRQAPRALGEDGRTRAPEHPPARYLVSKPGFLLQSEYQALSKEQKKLPPRDQQQCLKVLWAEEAEAQAVWEASRAVSPGD